MFKKIIAIFSSLSIASSAILSSTVSIQQESYIENKNLSNNNLISNDNDDLNLFITSLTDQNKQDGSFYDDVIFLKSLSTTNNQDLKNTYDINTKVKIFSSEKNLEEKNKSLVSNNKISLYDANLDVEEYEKISNQKDADGNSKTDITLSLINRYLSNGLLSFNPNSKPPSREEILKNKIYSQNIITFNPNLSAKELYSLSDYISVGIHWTHIDVTLKAKLINNLLVNGINDVLKACAKYTDKKLANSTLQEVSKVFKEQLKKLFIRFGTQLVAEIGADLSEEPWVDLVIVPLSEILTFMISTWISNYISNLIFKKTGIDDLIKLFFKDIENNVIAPFIYPGSIFLGLKITIGITKEPIKFDIEKPQNVIPWTIITPSLPDNKLNSEGSLLGTSNTCLLYISDQDFDTILHSSNPIEDMKKLGIYNEYITLTNENWDSILDEIYKNLGIKYFRPSKDYGVLLIIQNGNLEYTNLIKNHNYDLPLGKDGYLLASFVGNNNDSNLLISSDQIQNLFNSFDYINDNWDEIKQDENPIENNLNDYFYDNYLANYLNISNTNKQSIINDFNNLKNSNLNLINMTADKKEILDINFVFQKIEFKN